MTSWSPARRRGRIALIAGWVALAVSSMASPTSAGAGVPPPTDATTACTVSELLVPSCGAWLGTSPPSRDVRTDFASGLREYEAVATNVPDIIHFYKTGSDEFPTADEVALSERDGLQTSLLFYSWKPSTRLSWQQIANGEADVNIRLVADSLQRYPNRLFLGIHHEPENDQGPPGSGRTPADYVAMFRHVVTTLRAEGVTNVVFVMNFMGFAGWSSVADEFYPGDDVVDWIAYDPYAHAGQPTFESLLNRPTGEWPGFYDWAVARAPGKPIMLGEFGFDLVSQPAGPQALDGAVDVLKSRFPMLKALVYWNSKTDEFNYRIDQPGDLGQAYGAAYSRMANDPYFNSTPVAGHPPETTVPPPATAVPTTVVSEPVVAAPNSTDCFSNLIGAATCETGVLPGDPLAAVSDSRSSWSLAALVTLGVLATVFARRRRPTEPGDPDEPNEPADSDELTV